MSDKLSNNYVPPDGALKAKIMLVGEAPGRDEDREGKPFVGRAGRLLDKLLLEAGTNRSRCWVTNVVKYRPPANRTPTWKEILEGRVELFKEIDLVKPKSIVALGATATRALLGREKIDSVTKMRTKLIRYRNIRIFPTYHPAAALRDKGWIPKIIEDLKRSEQWSNRSK